MEIINQNTWLYQFLIEPSYRWLRHLTLIILVILISFNQLNHIIDIQTEQYRYFAYLPVLWTFILYLTAGYLNIYYLIPRFFLTRRFNWYIICFILIILGISLLLLTGEYLILKIPGIDPKPGSYFYEHENLFMTLLSDMLVLAISLLGCSVTVVLKSWFLENIELNQLTHRKIQIDVEQVKEKVSPDFLFSILHTMGKQAETEPARSSAMLMYLSRLLRYQLYEGNQEKVLLKAEIQFLSNYLFLEQYHIEGFDFSIKTEGNLDFIFIAPLLFLPFIQQAINEWKITEQKKTLQFFFVGKEEQLHFGYHYPDTIQQTEITSSSLFRRLNLLYKERFHSEQREEDQSFNLILQL